MMQGYIAKVSFPPTLLCFLERPRATGLVSRQAPRSSKIWVHLVQVISWFGVKPVLPSGGNMQRHTCKEGGEVGFESPCHDDVAML